MVSVYLTLKFPSRPPAASDTRFFRALPLPNLNPGITLRRPSLQLLLSLRHRLSLPVLCPYISLNPTRPLYQPLQARKRTLAPKQVRQENFLVHHVYCVCRNLYPPKLNLSVTAISSLREGGHGNLRLSTGKQICPKPNYSTGQTK